MSVATVKIRETKVIRPPEHIRADVKWSYQSLLFLHLPLLILLAFFYPPLAAFYSAWLLADFYLNIYREVFEDPDKKTVYEKAFMVKIEPLHFIQFGYRLEMRELDRHINELKKKSFATYLKNRAKKVLSNFWEYWRIVGLPKNLLTIHLWLIGTTGAGKTSTIMTGLKNQALRGGGAIMVDGKADEKMNKQLYSILKEVGREGDYYLLNFLNIDKYKEHTNSFNPLTTFTPSETVQFMSDLAGGGEGDQAYWKGRGISLLTPITYFAYFRRDHFGEPFSYETISNLREAKSFAFAGAVVYALMKQIDETLKRDERLKTIYARAKRTKIPETEFTYAELFEAHLAQNPEDRERFESYGYNYKYLEDLKKLLEDFSRYAKDIASAYWEGIKTAGNLFYERLGDAIAQTSINELRALNEEIENQIRQLAQTKQSLLIYAEPSNPAFEKAIQQHQYASQQWTNVFNFFALYRHIFGVVDGDIEIADIIRNNKFLYVLLPPLKQSKEVTEFLGKLMVISIARAASLALGGPVEKTNDQDEVLKMQITPVPPFLVILDEYGAYPVPGIDTILAQVRSIQISTWVSTQDFTSGRVGGTDENSVRRLWGNTQTKIVLATLDLETLENLQKVIPQETIRQFTGAIVDTKIIDEFTFQTAENPVLDPKNIQAFEKGLSVIFSRGQVVLTQMFYEDPDPADKVYITKYRSFS